MMKRFQNLEIRLNPGITNVKKSLKNWPLTVFRVLLLWFCCTWGTTISAQLTPCASPATAPVIEKVPNDAEVCAGDALTTMVLAVGFGGTGSCGGEYRYSTDGGTTWSAWGGVPNFTAVAGTNLVEVRRSCDGGVCGSATNQVSWIVKPNPQATILPVGGFPFTSVNVGAVARFLASPIDLAVPNVATYGFTFSGSPVLTGSGQFGTDGSFRNRGATYGPSDVGIQTVDLTVIYTNGCSSVAPQHEITVNCATAPGGECADLGLWLKANGGVTAPGNQVTEWADQSGAAITTQASATASADVLLNAATANFNPAVQFNGATDKSLKGLAAFDWGASPVSIFIVAKNEGSTTPVAGLFSTKSGYGPNNAGPGIVWGGGRYNLDGSGCGAALTGTLTNQYRVVRGVYTSGDNTNGGSSWLDGGLQAVGGPCANTGGADFEIGGRTQGGGALLNRIFSGEISEVIVYRTNLSPTNAQRVESYLAVKYGITLDQSSPVDYLASNGIPFWSAASAGIYNNDIAGIGRDDQSVLAQKQSRSINTDEIVTIGLGAIAASNVDNGGGFASNLQFLTWANNDGSKAYADRLTDVPGQVTDRMERTWQAQEYGGNVGNTEILFDLTGLGFTGVTAGDYYLLVDNDGDFSNAVAIAATSYDDLTKALSFGSVNLTNGQFFTIGHISCDVEITNVTTTPEICPGANDGTITITATTSRGPLTYAISGPVNLSNGIGVFTSLPPGNYDITVTDNGSANCLATEDATVAAGVDITPPTINCTAINGMRNADAGKCTFTMSGTGFNPTFSDNCPGATIRNNYNNTASLSGAIFPVGTTTVVWTVTDAANLTATCTINIVIADNQPPTAVCSNYTVTFNGQANFTLNPGNFVVATDNCGIASINLSNPVITCANLGQVIPVTATVTDVNGNTATCTSQITVGGLPCGWSHNSGSLGCESDLTYNASTKVWNETAVDCYYSPPFNSDELAFAQYRLCGNGSLTARVTNITGDPYGWGGITMRESNTQGSKKVQLITNLNNLSRRETRYTTGGTSYPQQFPSNQRYWLRLTRTGNQIVGYVSPNGTQWFLVMAETVNMNNCLEIGLIVTNYNPVSNVTATFDNVSVTGGSSSLVGAINELPLQDFSVFPNPTTGEINLGLSSYIGQAVQLEVYNLQGQLLQLKELDEVEATTERLELSGYQNGMYLIRVKTEGVPGITKRIVLNGMN
ncbi:MAG: T9SS type A sorting domain-containing protein [Saprospiraceae bacterium]